MSVAICSAEMGVGGLVVRPAVIVSAHATLREVAETFKAANVACALVGGPSAIITERDLAEAWAGGASGEEEVSALAQTPVTVMHSTPIVDAAALMLNRHASHLVVEMGAGGVGVVWEREVLAVLLQALQPEIWLTTLKVTVTPSELWLG